MGRRECNGTYQVMFSSGQHRGWGATVLLERALVSMLQLTKIGSHVVLVPRHVTDLE